jgi:hypothetical protein
MNLKKLQETLDAQNKLRREMAKLHTQEIQEAQQRHDKLITDINSVHKQKLTE